MGLSGLKPFFLAMHFNAVMQSEASFWLSQAKQETPEMRLQNASKLDSQVAFFMHKFQSPRK